MKIIVLHPGQFIAERQYIIGVILGEFLGLEFECQVEPSKATTVTVAGEDPPKAVIVSDVFFNIPNEKWLTPESLPTMPLRKWDSSKDLPEAQPQLVSYELPVIYGNYIAGDAFFEDAGKTVKLGLDVFGSAFFMLTRYEEMVTAERDVHGRFAAHSSVAYKSEFLERPVIDEYVEILWASMKRLWPGLHRKDRKYQLALSHDVDHPSASLNQAWPQTLKSAAGDLLKRSDPSLAWKRVVSHIGIGNWYGRDPNNTFAFIMDVSERVGVQSAFFFIADNPRKQPIDGCYSLEMPWIRKLLRTIHVRGHEIGLHSSYYSFQNDGQINFELRCLYNAAEQEGIRQSRWGNRQHFLRWDHSTWNALSRTKLDYDSSLCYAEHPGFRCGVCREFPAFDLQRHTPLSIRERPLILMDVSLDANYMSLSTEQSLAKVRTLSKRCRTVGGIFTFLFHNSSLITGYSKRLYQEAVNICLEK